MNDLVFIKKFLDGNTHDEEFKYIVNVEIDTNTSEAECIIHKPNTEPYIKHIRYTPFLYTKDLEKHGVPLYANQAQYVKDEMLKKYGITITKLKTGGQERLENGFIYKYTSSISYSAILSYFSDGGIDIYDKKRDSKGRIVKNSKGDVEFKYRDYFYSVKPDEQFFISTGARLFGGYDEYHQIHKLIFDIETTGLNFLSSRVFAIGIKDNKGNELVLTASKLEDDDAERELIKKFFSVITHFKPAIIAGYNSESFDFEFINGRATVLGLDLKTIKTTLKDGITLKRKPNSTVKYGTKSDRYTSTKIWGVSVIDIIHATKRTAAMNSDIKEYKLKYIAKLENIAKPNRTYIDGEDNKIYKFYKDNNAFVCDEKNEYIQVPNQLQDVAKKIILLQENKEKIGDENYSSIRNGLLKENPEFVQWFRDVAIKNNKTTFISGRRLLRQYLLDDLWETDKVDELYNQSSFMLAKIIPTNYSRICTMGTAAVWNLLMVAWSYDNNMAIPYSEKKDGFSGGLARTFFVGYSKNWTKIDFASLYPMLQLTFDIFPIFDTTNVIKKFLMYLTTTRNIYKKLANGSEINEKEIELLSEIDHDTYVKYMKNIITDTDKALFKIKQLPIKILNNSLFGALGSGVAFNWSDNICAARITCLGRIYLRKTIKWFEKFDCLPLLAVTDGVNFKIPNKTKITFDGDEIINSDVELDIEDAWKYNGKTGVSALIERYNVTELSKVYHGGTSYMSVDNDGNFISCYNLSRINYATKSLVKNKKTGEMEEKIKFTGNTIKSNKMPEYIKAFIDKGLKYILDGDGVSFVNYYQSYAEDIYYKQIPLKMIASKDKVNSTIKEYLNRGVDKNGRPKAKQAYMELIIEERQKIVEELFEKHKFEFDIKEDSENISLETKQKYVEKYMPPEPEKDTYVYYVNKGNKNGDGNSKIIIDKLTGKERFASVIINAKDLAENPNMKGDYNSVRYLNAFNKRIVSLLKAFNPEIVDKIIVKEVKVKKKGLDGKTVTSFELQKNDISTSDLKLGHYEFDSLEDVVYLEDKEISFWNKTGYDPRLIWDEFKTPDSNKIEYDIYQNKLNYLNDLMRKNGKKEIKSINEILTKDDFVLIKNDNKYHLGYHNGEYVKIVKEITNLPKTEKELEIEEKRKKIDEKLSKLVISENDDETIEDKYEYALEYIEDFKKKFKIDNKLTIFEIFETIQDSEEIFNLFIREKMNEDFDIDAENYDD